MEIVSALFAENIDLRPVPGPSTRIDLTGIMFSLAAPSEPPVTVAPHLIVLVRCRPDEDGQGILEVVFADEGGGQPRCRVHRKMEADEIDGGNDFVLQRLLRHVDAGHRPPRRPQPGGRRREAKGLASHLVGGNQQGVHGHQSVFCHSVC